MQFRVGQQHDGVLLRSYLKGTCGVSSRLLIQLKKRTDGIQVNGEHVTVRYLLHEGDLVEIREQDTDAQDVFTPVSLSVPIVYEDEDLLIVEKPPQMPTHPSAGHDGDTLANALTFLFQQRGEPFVFRPVSRLDRNTSGLLTLAKNQYSASALCSAMLRHEIKKTYLAITDGCPEPSAGRIETGTRRAKDFFVLREVCPLDALGALRTVTDYRVIERFGTHSLLELRPLTGRTHQIRVQLSHLGCPVTGDDLYGTPSPFLHRHALHASCLELRHPRSGEPLTFRSPLPRDLQMLCERFREM